MWWETRNKRCFFSCVLIYLGLTSFMLLHVTYKLSTEQHAAEPIQSYRKSIETTASEENSIEKTMIYSVTPTYTRPTQKADLTRLSQTFLHIKNFHWILIEDSETKTTLVTSFLQRSGLHYTHLNIATPDEYKTRHDPPRGFSQRNLALDWLQDNAAMRKGVIYFADDDNVYDLQLFEEMRKTSKVSVWPVGFTGECMHAGPVCKHGHVIGFRTNYAPERAIPLDMAGFAINLRFYLQHSSHKFNLDLYGGWRESEFLSGLVSQEQLEPKADMCSKVLVWHVRTETPTNNVNGEEIMQKAHVQYWNLSMEV